MWVFSLIPSITLQDKQYHLLTRTNRSFCSDRVLSSKIQGIKYDDRIGRLRGSCTSNTLCQASLLTSTASYTLLLGEKNGTESAQSHHTKGQWCKKLIKPCYRRGPPAIWRPSENNTVVLGLTTPFSSRVYAKFQGSKTLPPSQLQPQTWPCQVYPSARPQKWIPFILSSEMLRKS